MAAALGAFACAGAASAQQPGMGCTAQQSPGRPQILRCGGGLTIVAEDGATFTLRDRNNHVDGIDLQNKAVFVEAPKKKTG
jgi:hypothetical protein